MVVPAFAADNPLTVVNNLSEFIFSLIRAIGLILLGFPLSRTAPAIEVMSSANCGISVRIVSYYLPGEVTPADTHYGNLLKAKEWGFRMVDAFVHL